MNNISIITDYSYLPYFLALYESIGYYNQLSNYAIHVLCTDDRTYEKLNSNNFSPILLYRLEELEELEDWEVLVKNNEENIGGTSSFHCALGSYFTHYLIFHKDIENCLYSDADIYFYNNIDCIFNIMKGYDIGLITHKHQNRDDNHQTGFYNVGIVYFSNSDDGKKCLELWKNCVVDPHNKWAKTHGTCWDQKYLELFETIIDKKKICEIDKFIGNTAPWNFSLSKITEDKDRGNEKELEWGCKNVFSYINKLKQKLIFHHFSHFRLVRKEDIKDDLNYGKDYKVDWNNEWGPESWYNGIIKEMYEEYTTHMYGVLERYDLEYELWKLK